jgi:biopolymer transport protein TolR
VLRERPVTTMTGSLESTTVRISPARLRGRRSNELICYINVTGLVSVMLALLVMFMVLRVFERPGHGVDVDLAKVSFPKALNKAEAEDALMIGVGRDGRIFFRTDALALEQLPPHLRDAINKGAEKKAYIRADARSSYGDVKSVLDAVRASGVENIAFLTEQRRPQAIH